MSIRPRRRPINGKQPRDRHGGPGAVACAAYPVHLSQNTRKTAASLEQPSRDSGMKLLRKAPLIRPKIRSGP